MLLIAGLMLAALGAVIMLGDRLPFRLGRLPGDIAWRGKNTTFYFPLTTLILMNLAIWLAVRLFHRG